MTFVVSLPKFLLWNRHQDFGDALPMYQSDESSDKPLLYAPNDDNVLLMFRIDAKIPGTERSLAQLP